MFVRRMKIHRSEINSIQWMNTTPFATDGKEHFREKKGYGNRHAIFERGSVWGTVHHDEHNATDFPVGTVNHVAKYANEQTGVNEGVARLAIWGLGIFAAYKMGKWLLKNS